MQVQKGSSYFLLTFTILNNTGFPILINTLAPSCWGKCCSSCSMKQAIWAGRKWFGWSFSQIEGLTGGVRGNGRILTDNVSIQVQGKMGSEKLCKNLISYGWNNKRQHWNMLTDSSGRSVCYTSVQWVPQRRARYRTWSHLFFQYSFVKITGEHEGVMGVYFQGWTHTSHIFYCKVKLHIKYCQALFSS